MNANKKKAGFPDHQNRNMSANITLNTITGIE